MATLKYDFSVIGAKNIDRAFASIERRAVQHNMRMSREFGGSRGGVVAAKSPASAARVADMATKRRLASEVAAERKAAREKVRLDKWRQDMRNRHWQQEERNRRKAEAAEVRASQRALRERRRAAGAIFGQAGSSVRNTTRAVGTMVGGALAIGGGFMASAAVGQQMRETAAASQLANQAGRPEIKGQLLRESQSVRGFTGEESLGALSGFVDLTGDLDTARRLLKDLGKISLATGTEFADMSTLAGNLANNLSGIEDPAKRAEAILSSIKGLTKQGELGSVEVKHLASQGGSLAAIAGGIGGDPGEALKIAGVLTQVAKTKSSSPEEALTAAQNFVDFAGTKADKIEGLGITDAFVKGEDGANVALRDPRKLIKDIFTKTGGDIGTITKLFGQRGQRVFKGFGQAYQGAGGGQAGLNAIDELFNKFNQTLSDKDINERVASRLSDPDLQFKQVMKDFNAQVGSELLPVLTKLIPEFAKLLPHVTTAARIFGKLVEELADNPLMTLGKIIAAKVALDIASARIGDVIKNGIVDSVSGGGSGSDSATASGSGSRGLNIGNAVLNGVTIGAAAGLAIYASGVVNFEASEAQIDRAGGRVSEARQLYAAAKDGDMSVMPRLIELLKEQKTDTDKVSERNIAAKETTGAIDSVLNAVLPGWMTGDVVSKDTPNGLDGEGGLATSLAETLGFIQEGQQRTNEKFEKSISDLVRAAEKLSRGADKLDGAGDKLSAVTPGGGGSPNRPTAPTI